MNPDLIILIEKEKKERGNMNINNFTIEKGIPAPRPHIRGGFISILRKMDIGDSVLVPRPERNRVLSNAYHAASKTGMKVVSRKNSDGSVRLWRIK